MKRNHLYLLLCFVSLACFGGCLGMFAAPFVTYSLLGGSTSYSGYELAFNFDNSLVGVKEGGGVCTFIALIAIAFGALSALAFVCLRMLELAGQVKINRKKKASSMKVLCYFVCYVLVCGILPLVLCLLSRVTTGFNDMALGSTGLGVGAILSGIFAFVGGATLFISETALLG